MLVLAVVGGVAVAVTQGSPSHSATPETVALTSSARHRFAGLGELVGAGDRGVWFLTASTDPDFPAYALVNAQGRYLFARGDVRGGDRTDSLVRSAERMNRTQLQDAVLVAATSISR